MTRFLIQQKTVERLEAEWHEAMADSILFLTGHLAKARLEAVLNAMDADFEWKVVDIGVKVAALMTEDIILRRLQKPVEAGRIMLPGRARADLDRLAAHYGAPVLRGPDEVKDLPEYFGRARKASDMTKYDIKIFAEIVDASALSVEAILERAEDYSHKGTGRDRSRLPARYSLPASGRGGARVERSRLQIERRFRRCR
jgi:hypothetical protein